MLMNLRETYDLIADDWHRDHQKDDWWVKGTDKFIELLPAGARVLDAGCGAGNKSRYLSEKGLKVTGIDFSKNLIAIAEREAPQATFRVLDIRQVDELNEEYDGIFMQAALLHFPKAEAVEILGNLAKKLVAGGFFYVAVKESRKDQLDEQILKENDYGYPYERFFSYYTQQEIEEYFQKLSLEVVFSEVSYYGDTGWIQVIGKK